MYHGAILYLLSRAMGVDEDGCGRQAWDAHGGNAMGRVPSLEIFFFCLSFFALVRPRPPFLPIRYALARLTEEMEDARWLKGVGGCMQGISDPGFYVRKVQAQDQ